MSNNKGTSLLVFEDEVDEILLSLKQNVIRMASNHKKPWNPLRDGKEIDWDGDYAQKNSNIGISLAASFKQLNRVFRPGKKNWLLAINRNQIMPVGLELQVDTPDHWSIIVTERMHRDVLITKLESIARQWKTMGRYIRYE